MPRIIKRLYLCLGFLAGCTSEQNVVVLAAVKRRVEVNEVHALVVNAAKDDEIIAVVEPVHSFSKSSGLGPSVVRSMPSRYGWAERKYGCSMVMWFDTELKSRSHAWSASAF